MQENLSPTFEASSEKIFSSVVLINHFIRKRGITCNHYSIIQHVPKQIRTRVKTREA